MARPDSRRETRPLSGRSGAWAAPVLVVAGAILLAAAVLVAALPGGVSRVALVWALDAAAAALVMLGVARWIDRG